MQRLLLAAALGLAACGMDVDDRADNLEYITAAILAPNCGNAQCHSSFHRAEDYAFDTVEETRATLEAYEGLVIPGEPADSVLYEVLVSPGGENQKARMPYDQPLANKDVALIYKWIENGADGLVLP